MPPPEGDPLRPPSMPPSQIGGPSRMRTQSYSPREEEDDNILPSQPQGELLPPLPQRSPLRTPSCVITSPEDTPVPLRQSTRLRRPPTRYGNVYGETKTPHRIEKDIERVRDWESQQEDSETHSQPQQFV